MQEDNVPKHTANTKKGFIRGKVLDWPSQSPDRDPLDHAFHLMKRRLKEEGAETSELKVDALKEWKGITNGECKC